MLLALCSGCAIFGRSDSTARSENAAETLDLAETEIAAGEYEQALRRLLAVRELTGLLPEVRARDKELIERCAEELLALYRSEEYSSSDFSPCWVLIRTRIT